MKRNFNIRLTFSNVGIFKIPASNYVVFLQTLERFPSNLQYIHTETDIIHCYTPSLAVRYRTWRGGNVILALAHNFISTSETLVQRGM
jgi:hypothetical protein